MHGAHFVLLWSGRVAREEAPGLASNPPKRVGVLAVVQGEEFVSAPSASTEEAALSQLVSRRAPSAQPPWAYHEDFAGSAPREETLTALTFGPVAAAAPIARGEDFAGALPLEENTLALAVIMTRPWVTEPRRDEPFAGALPLEEPSSALALRSAPVWIGWRGEEEFAGAHPSEDVAAAISLPAQTAYAPLVFSEAFAGSLPLEEAPASTTVRFEHVWRSSELCAEEFAGSLPLEERAPPAIVRVAAVPLVLAARTEAFVRSLPVDEQPMLLRVLGAPLPIALSRQDEPVVSAPIDEGAPLLVVPPPPRWCAAAVLPEELTASRAIDEAPVLQRASFDHLTLAPLSYAEDVASGVQFIAEEASSPIIIRPPPPWIGVLVTDEGIVQPSPPPPGPLAFLLAMGGGCEPGEWECGPNSYGISADLLQADMLAGLMWELGDDDDYGRRVSFPDFERKILHGYSDASKRDGFKQMASAFASEERERLKIVKAVITVGGISYVVWRVILWL